jgi:thymidylate kinase
MFIVFEGLDRVGKTTQVKLLAEKIPSSVVITFPNREGIIGKILDSYLKNKISLTTEAAHLLFSADRWEKKEFILNNITNGGVLIADRYIYSGLAYSIANGLSYDWCMKSDEGLPKPDIVVFIQKETTKSYSEKYENVLFQEKVKTAYNKIMEESWLIFDYKDIEELHSEIYKKVKDFL